MSEINNNYGAAGLWGRLNHHSFKGNPSPVIKKEPEQHIKANKSDFVCSICRVFVFQGHGVELQNCKHNLCRTCLNDAIVHDKTSGAVLCPMALVNCKEPITPEEIEALLTPADYLKFLNQRGRTSMSSCDTVPLLLQLEDFEFVSNYSPFECQICLTTVEPGNGLMLKNCLHEFCKICLEKAIEMSAEPEVRCPYVASTGTRCEGFLQDRELRCLISQEVYSAHLSKSLAQAEAQTANSFHCKTPDCPGWAELTEGATTFTCPVCSKTNCVKCKVIHEGKTCEQVVYENNDHARKIRDDRITERQVNRLILTKKAMKCPKCGVVIEKNKGCNHMTCSRCQHEFQWLGLE